MPFSQDLYRHSLDLSDRTGAGQESICAIKTQGVSKDPISSKPSAELVTLWHGGCTACRQ
jgi:hypothetical protein